MRSIRSCSLARTSSSRGIVLISALILALLYFALMELLMIDSSRALAESRRFRARIIAANLAENGAELAAMYITTRVGNDVNQTDDAGTMTGKMRRNVEAFTITGDGAVAGLDKQEATVYVQGRVSPSGSIAIDYTVHGQ